MPTHDLFHDAVKHGLTKDGWTITADPLIVEFSGHDMYIDLGAEKLIAAEKDNQQIAVEVKSFIGRFRAGRFSHRPGTIPELSPRP